MWVTWLLLENTNKTPSRDAVRLALSGMRKANCAAPLVGTKAGDTKHEGNCRGFSMRLEVQDFRRAMGWDGSLALFPANRFPDGCLFHP